MFKGESMSAVLPAPKERLAQEKGAARDNFGENSEFMKSKNEFDDFRSKIKNLGSLPSDQFKRIFKSFSSEKADHLELDDKQILEVMTMLRTTDQSSEKSGEIDVEQILFDLVNNSNPEQNKSKVLSIKNLVKKGGLEKAEYIQKSIIKILQESKVTLSTLVLLGELSTDENFKITDELITAIEFNNFPAPQLMDQLAILNRLNTGEGNLLLHKILDYLEQHLFFLQNDPENKLHEEDHRFYVGLHDKFLKKEVEHSENYLVKKHLQDQVESLEQYSSRHKEGAISGTAGGTNDSTIYTFKHLADSYYNRIALGIADGYAIANPILEVAPGYYGYYYHGKIIKIFKSGNNLEVEKMEENQARKNNRKYDYIYDEINAPDNPRFAISRYPDDSYKMEKLRVLWDFKERLESDQEKFFYDISKIDLASLHPIVRAEFFHDNIEYLKTNNLLPNRAQLSEKEIAEKFFIQKDFSEEELYQYLNLTKLHMRKKIADDFGIEIADCNFATQRNFLQFLEERNVVNVEELIRFVKTYGENGLAAFLSLELGSDIGDKIIQIGEKLDQADAQKVFAKIAELADFIEKENAELSEMFLERKKGVDMSGTKLDLLKKVQEIILRFNEEFEDGKSSQEKIAGLLDELDEIKTEILAFKSIFKATIKEHPEAMFEDFKDLEVQFDKREISENDRKEMVSVIEKNYPDLEERTIALAGLDKGLRNEGTTFKILRHKGKVVSFLRFDQQAAEGNLYFGSFNTSPDFQGAYIGDEVMKECLESELMFGAKRIEAHTFPDKKITSKYVEDAKFVITDIELDYLGTSKALFKIERYGAYHDYKYVNRLGSEAKKEFEKAADSGVISESKNPFLKLSVVQLKDVTVLEKIKNFMQKNNLVITRYFPDDRQNPKYFILAFEAKLPKL